MIRRKSTRIPPEIESEQLLKLTDNNIMQAISILESQMNVLHLRAQVLMSLASIVLTITGFSGRAIAGSSLLAKILIIAGLVIVLTSAVWIFLRVMSIKWLTTENLHQPKDALETIIKRRNIKTRAFSFGGIILCAGLFFYVAAFAIMLLKT